MPERIEGLSDAALPPASTMCGGRFPRSPQLPRAARRVHLPEPVGEELLQAENLELQADRNGEADHEPTIENEVRAPREADEVCQPVAALRVQHDIDPGKRDQRCGHAHEVRPTPLREGVEQADHEACDQHDLNDHLFSHPTSSSDKTVKALPTFWPLRNEYWV